MRKSRSTDSQLIAVLKFIAVLKQSETGVQGPDLCREHGISSGAFYRGRFRFGGIGTLVMKRLKELQDKNWRSKKIYAEERLKAGPRKEALEGKW